MEKVYEKEVGKKLMTFKALNQLHLTEALDPTIVLEMGLNEDDEDTKDSKKKTTIHNEWCTPLGILFLLFSLCYITQTICQSLL